MAQKPQKLGLDLSTTSAGGFGYGAMQTRDGGIGFVRTVLHCAQSSGD